jgi:ribosomal VAR1-like protein
MGILKRYFNLFNDKLERKIRAKRLLLRLRRLSLHKIYISNGEFKHTNNKVLINIYLYNRQKYNYIHKLNNIYIEKMLKAKNRKNIIDKLKSIRVKGLKEESNMLKKSLNVLNKRDYRINTSKFMSEYITNLYNKVLKISIRRIRMYFLYKQLMFINKSKLNYTYLQLLKKLLEKLYNKNVEFNLINLKRSYLNSDILFEVIKLKLTRNRRKMLKTMNKMKNKIKLHKKCITVDSMHTYKKDLRNNKLNIFVINNLKYKHVTGFRLEAKGRLTRRYTASRSISKVRYNGNLLNIDSSYKGLSSTMLKGNLKSNVQYTKLISKTRIGSFGLKG